MFDPVNEPSFRLEIAGQPQPFVVVAFTGCESISQPFVFQLDLQFDELRLDIASLMFRSAYLGFGGAGTGIHGQIHDLAPLHDDAVPALWRLCLGPKLACLAQRCSQRIFSGLSVPQILVQVLKEHGIDEKNCRFELRNDYPVREFCTQYRESDLAFLQRLCEQERIHYHFQHRKHGHCLIFADTRRSSSPGAGTPFDSQGTVPAVRRFTVHAHADGARHDGLPKPVAAGETDLPNLRSGMLMALSGHPFADWNHLWLLTRVEHSGSQAQLPYYRNRIDAIPWEAPFVAFRPSEKPRMNSLQRGWVVNVDEPRSDAAQRIAVQFDWLYQGEGARPSHCWLPVSPQLSTESVAGLTAGVEVCVSFIEGDPDQPLITGIFQGAPLNVDGVLPVETSLPSMAGEALPAREELSPDDRHDLLALVQGSQPLVLLCLIPGGGSFMHCRQAICTCRTVAGLGQSGAA
ncbi:MULTISPECIES: contractile injection system protein, VgrG/Pvc8 family [unclassified Pseudomonas]|uniref:contractile injection system protein, VgrG/Pvc8 family n=1 Tax=unclassified Pseudomonas TaxID=196821 RepID=UPI000CD26377|nr:MULTISPECIES: contractile injection system protein, VgrG/Pvc8 family [unclassified Pseudomonas]POA30335.1 type VI secretion protein [Pseudomonas sp. GW456-R21]POA67141.1 type VI secretion protein [Pseudomonas sp. GW460-R15]